MHSNILSVAFIVVSLLTTSLRSEVELSEHHLLYQIGENAHYCVEKYSGDKIFLKPQNIVFANSGLLLNLNGCDLVALPLVQINHLGWFIEIDYVTAAKKDIPIEPCPACDVNTNKQGRCQNPLCKFHGMKVL